MYGLALVLAFVGLAGLYAGIPEWVMFYGFMALFSLYFWAIMHAWKVMKFVRASRSAHRLLPHSDEEREGYLGVRTED
jgi:UDP-GlcNAc:undecaprenyl-phosphate GlcNAc-1-phosphate transferase